MEGDPYHLKFWVNDPSWSEIADFEQIIIRSASAVTTSENNSINTNRKVYHALSNEPKMIIVRCP